MKHLSTFFCALLWTTLVCAEPYFVRVNGTTDYPAEPLSEQDFQGRQQYQATCILLKTGDIVTCYDQGNDAQWSIAAIDPYGAYEQFDCTPTGLVAKQDGQYNFYIKLKFEDDLWYVETAADCEDTPQQPDPDEPEQPDEPTLYDSSVPTQCPDVMLQAFYWDSYQDKGHGDTRWQTLLSQAGEIAAYFDLVWLPPSAKSSGGVGYHPAQYSNQNSAWGTRAYLEQLIATLHAGGAKVIADIVINHAANKSSWCDFYEQDFGEYGHFKPDASWICQTDEVNTSASGDCKGAATGAKDDGYGGEANYGAARDWDHDSEQVREMFRAYLQWMKNDMHYDGWRYDYCKGFHNSHIDDYNRAAGNYFSVMEYWDGNANTLQARLKDANWNTLTFDFATKYAAFNNAMAAGNYAGCKAPGLLGAGKSKYAVTFIDSHDTYQRDGNEFGGKGNSMKPTLQPRLLQANAFMLSMPGIPCVFYPHWIEYKDAIAPMILARKAVQVHSESTVQDEGDNHGYRATIAGKNGTLILELGNRVANTPAGYTKAASGEGYTIYIKPNSPVAPTLVVTPATATFKTETLTITMKTIGGTETNPMIYYTLDGSDPRTSTTRLTYSAPFEIRETLTLKAYVVTDHSESEVQTYEYTKKEPQTTPLVVAFYKPSHWSKVYLYSWHEGDYTEDGTPTGKWPGTELTEKNANGFHYYQFDPAIKEINFIFNGGNGKEQTSDLWTDEDVCYAWSAGAEVLVPDCVWTSLEETERDTPTLDLNAPMYNILGQQVDKTYKGIIIQNGYKYLVL